MASTDKFAIHDEDFDNTDDLISSGYDPTDIDDDGQKDLPCCWCCRSDFKLFCRFRIFYFMYYIAYQTGILYVSKELASQIKGGDDAYDNWSALFLAIAAFVCFLFSIFLGYLSDINGRRRYIRYTVLITTIPFLGVLIYPDIWLYFGLVPLFGFVGSTSILSGLFITYIADVMPPEYLAAGYASIHAIEGTAGLAALGIAGALGLIKSGDYQRIALGVIFSLFVLAMLFCLCCVKESLPLQRRNIRSANEGSKWRCCKIFIETIKTNRILYYMIAFYFCILFPFQGIEELISEKSNLSLVFHGDTSGILFIILSAGVYVGKSMNPCILCCTNKCCKKVFYKLVCFMVILVMAVTFLITMAAYKPEIDKMVGLDDGSSGSSGSSNTITNTTSSIIPSLSPTSMDPTLSPSPEPTGSPSTPFPTWNPVHHSISPTLEPTLTPSAPTMEPTVSPESGSDYQYPTYSPNGYETTQSDGDEGGGGLFGGVDSMKGLYGFIFAFVAGLIFAWSKLLLPLINVLVRGSANKLERGRTFGVLSSIESICTYGAPLAVINLWESDYPFTAFVLCMVLVIIGFIWLFVKIKKVIMMNGRVPAFEEWNGAGGASYDAQENRGISDNRHQDLFDL